MVAADAQLGDRDSALCKQARDYLLDALALDGRETLDRQAAWRVRRATSAAGATRSFRHRAAPRLHVDVALNLEHVEPGAGLDELCLEACRSACLERLRENGERIRVLGSTRWPSHACHLSQQARPGRVGGTGEPQVQRAAGCAF